MGRSPSLSRSLSGPAAHADPGDRVLLGLKVWLHYAYKVRNLGRVCPRSLAAAGGATGAMAPPLAREGGAILSFGPTFELEEER